MRERCRGALIAVDVSREREIYLHEERYPTGWSALWRRIKPQKGPPPPPNIAEILARAVSLGTAASTGAVARDADLSLRPRSGSSAPTTSSSATPSSAWARARPGTPTHVGPTRDLSPGARLVG